MKHLQQIRSSENTTWCMGVDDKSLNFPLSISQLANAVNTTVHSVRNYVTEDLLSCCEHTPAGHGRYDRCALF